MFRIVLVNLIAKIGEKITIRRSNFFDNRTVQTFFMYIQQLEKNIGKIISIVKVDGVSKEKNQDIGTKVSYAYCSFKSISFR